MNFVKSTLQSITGTTVALGQDALRMLPCARSSHSYVTPPQLAKAVSDKWVLITGATSGIGKATATELARAGAKVMLVGRSVASATQAISDIKAATGVGTLFPINCDLQSMQEVAAATRQVQELLGDAHLSLIINNAGIMMTPFKLTTDNLEQQMHTNHISHFVLTLNLLGNLDPTARIVNVSSAAHRGAKGLTLPGPEGPPYTAAQYSVMGAYCESKLANLLFSNELQERLQRHNGLQNVRKHLLLVMLRQLPLRGGCSVVSVANGRTNRTATACVADTTAVRVAALHPGVVNTQLGRSLPAVARKAMELFGPWVLRSPDAAAKTVLLAAAGDMGKPSARVLYMVNSHAASTSRLAYDKKLQTKLWNWSLKTTGAHLSNVPAEFTSTSN